MRLFLCCGVLRVCGETRRRELLQAAVVSLFIQVLQPGPGSHCVHLCQVNTVVSAFLSPSRSVLVSNGWLCDLPLTVWTEQQNSAGRVVLVCDSHFQVAEGKDVFGLQDDGWFRPLSPP